MEAHEYASIFPMLPEAELQQLAADIKQNGLNNPIIKLDGKILDGRNRYAACKIAGIRPTFDEYQGDDPLAYVFSQNFTRRQLTESQKGMIGARYATLENGSNQYKKEGVSPDTPSVEAKSRKQAADMVGVGEATVGRARTVLTHGTPELVAAVESGQVTVNAAAQVAKLPHDEQRAVVEKGPEAVKEAAKADTKQPAEKRARRASMNLAIGNELAMQALIILGRILPQDKERGEALAKVRDYCTNRLEQNK